MNNTLLAPVLLFVYKRIQHTSKVIDSLLQNDQSRYTDLFIYSDGAKSLDDESDVNAVREYIQGIIGFKSINITYREKNYGLSKSIVLGVTEQLKVNEYVIVLEDDLVVAPNFLEYMNYFLHLYENDRDVVSIHGYVYPSTKSYPNTFFIKGADCWGWATWRRAWECYIENSEFLLSEIKKNKLEKEFDMNNSYPFTRMLQENAMGNNDSWAIRWYASTFLKGGLTLYPSKTLVDNIGFDGSGTHGGVTQKECVSLEKFEFLREKIAITESECGKKVMQKSLRKIYGLNIYLKSKRLLKKLLKLPND